MYSKPKVERFGTFRDLTRSGSDGGGDGCIVLDPANNSPITDTDQGSVAPFCNRS